MKTLKDVMPHEFMGSEYQDTRAVKFADVRVTGEFYGHQVRWPGTHKNVQWWVKLANGYAVGWNENPGRGWSFPVVKVK